MGQGATIAGPLARHAVPAELAAAAARTLAARDRPKADPELVALRDERRRHRALPCLSFAGLRDAFAAVHPGDCTRGDVERFLTASGGRYFAR